MASVPKVWNGTAWVSELPPFDAALPTQAIDNIVYASSNSPSVTATASATPHTVGPWVEVVPSLLENSDMLTIGLRTGTGSSAVNSSTLLNIGVGASGSEVVRIANVQVGWFLVVTLLQIPCPFNAGERISVQIQSAVASQTFQAHYNFGKYTQLKRPGVPVTMGANTATSRGVAIANPASLNTKGAWTEVQASTPAAFSALVPLLGANANTNMTAGQVLVDVGIGASGSEVVLIRDIFMLPTANETLNRYLGIRAYPALVGGNPIPAGSRLSMRYQRSAGSLVDGSLLGIPRS